MTAIAVTTGAASSAASGLYRELWISLASLIRSYAAAHDIGRQVGRALVEEGEDGHLALRSEGKILTLNFDAASGSGKWIVEEDEHGAQRVLTQGTFRMGEDSQVEFSDRRGRLELEVAAEAFTAKIFDEE